jgi:hypothetical protein
MARRGLEVTMAIKAKIIRDRDLGWSKLQRAVKRLKLDPSDGLEVGWIVPEVAERAAQNEFGTDRIPERPFVRPTIDQHQREYLDLMERGVERAALGEAPRNQALLPAANRIRSDLIEKIIDVRTPPNAPGTIARKGSSNPLVDTGEMQRTIQIRETRGGGD